MIHDPEKQRRAFDAWLACNYPLIERNSLPALSLWRAWQGATLFANVAEAEGFEEAIKVLEEVPATV